MTYWADLEGPQIYHLFLYLFAVGPGNTKYPRTGLIIGLRCIGADPGSQGNWDARYPGVPEYTWIQAGTRIHAGPRARADRGGPKIYHLSCYLFAAGTKHTKYPRTGLRIGLRGRFLVQPALFVEPEPVPRPPGPQGAENLPKTRGRIYHFILPKICPAQCPWASPGPPLSLKHI